MKDLGGKDVPAVGFALGLERLVQVVEAEPANKASASEAELDYFICSLGEAAQKKAFEILQKLRASGRRTDLDFAGKSLASQLKTADRRKAAKALILGEEELSRGVILEKDLSKAEQREIPLANF